MAVTVFTTVPELKAALTAAGILGTVYYEISPYFIFTTTLSNKVIKVKIDQGIYVGTSYTSGSTIVAETAISSSSSGSSVGVLYLITGTDFFCIILSLTSNITRVAVFCTGTDGTTKFALGFTSSTGTSQVASYVVTASTNTQITPLYNASNYQMLDVYLWCVADLMYKDFTSNRVLAIHPGNVKLMLKRPDPYITRDSEVTFVYGNDVIITAGQTSTNTSLANAGPLLLVGGGT